METPTHDDMLEPLFLCLKDLGGSASVDELEEKVADLMNLSEEQISDIHRGNRTKFSYRLAWSRTYLKHFGVVENSSRGVWVLTSKGQKLKSISRENVLKSVRKGNQKKVVEEPPSIENIDEQSQIEWQDHVLELVKKMRPEAFERLCQRILRESGFTSVEVTGQSGDGGIDGKGILRLGGLMSFHVFFQCKRYNGSISPSVVRDFRGAMVGRADKGLLITTGTFSREARREAYRDGAPPLDLLDGEELVKKLKELGMGIQVKQRTIEDVFVDEAYFKSI